MPGHRDAEQDVGGGDRLGGQARVLVADHHRGGAREVQSSTVAGAPGTAA